MVIGTPKSGGSHGNVCAFCHYWGGNVSLERYKINDVLYDDKATGQCLEKGSEYKATAPACPKFQMSNQASKFCKR